MINLSKLTPQENDLLNNLLDKYGAKDLLEVSYRLLDMENQERGGKIAAPTTGNVDPTRKSCSR